MKNTNWRDIIGTSIIAEIECSYDILEEAFGGPDEVSSEGERVTCLWRRRDNQDRLITIHDWKTHKQYTENTIWSIGGRHTDDSEEITLALGHAIAQATGYQIRILQIR